MNWQYSMRLWAVAAVILATVGCGNDGSSTERDQFLAARQLVVDGQYDVATGQLEKFIVDYPSSKFSSRAGLFLGKAYLAKDDLPQARKWFQWTIDNHRQTLEGHKCRYKLAMCDVLEENYDQALERFTALADKPVGPLAAEATAWQRWLQKRDAMAPAEADGRNK